MSYIFLDESGDLGFDFSNKKVSNFFVITCIYVKESNKKDLEKIVRKIISQINKLNRKKSKISSLHFNKEKPKTRNKFIKLSNEKEMFILAAFIDKKQVPLKLRNSKHFIYNEITKTILDKMHQQKKFNYVEISASRRETCRFLNKNFCTHIENHFSNKDELEIKISIDFPHKEKCLQIADAFSWTIFNKLEFKNDSYFKMIKNKIKIEKVNLK